MTEREKYMQVAFYAHSTLTAFQCVVALLEGGTVYLSECHDTQSKIIALCKREQQKLLVMHDTAISKIAAVTALQDRRKT